jgi:hypothetical protein
MTRGFSISAVCLLAVSCGDTVSLGDGKPQPDAALHPPDAGSDVAAGGTGGTSPFHDSAPQDSTAEHTVWQPCASKHCNEPCNVCDPADSQCVEPTDPHYCDTAGACTPHLVACN